MKVKLILILQFCFSIFINVFLFFCLLLFFINIKKTPQKGNNLLHHANQFIKDLRILSNLNDEPILIHLKSSGGDWVEGLAMYQAIQACPNHITMLNYASARSMSSIIFSAADYRVMMPYSTFMVHTGTNTIDGTGTQVRTEFEEVLKADRIMFDIYIEKLRKASKFEGWSDKRIENWLWKKMREKEEVYFTAEEAVEHNFADAIFGADGNYDWAILRE